MIAKTITIRRLFFLLLLPLASCSRTPNYATYEDCILAEIGQSHTQAAALIIRDACRHKFPPSSAETKASGARQQLQNALGAQAAAEAASAAQAAQDAADSVEPANKAGKPD